MGNALAMFEPERFEHLIKTGPGSQYQWACALIFPTPPRPLVPHLSKPSLYGTTSTRWHSMLSPFSRQILPTAYSGLRSREVSTRRCTAGARAVSLLCRHGSIVMPKCTVSNGRDGKYKEVQDLLRLRGQARPSGKTHLYLEAQFFTLKTLF